MSIKFKRVVILLPATWTFVLYDLNGQVMQKDNTTDQQPVMTIKPEKTATYYIVVHARALTDGQKDAGVSVAVTYR